MKMKEEFSSVVMDLSTQSKALAAATFYRNDLEYPENGDY